MTLSALTRSLTRATALAALTSTLLLASQPACAVVAVMPYSGLYVFGDSLSDNGNLFAATGIPPAPYFSGRFSNGPVAVEYLASNLGMGAAQMHNYAIAGAKTGTGGQLPNSGMLNQLTSFQSSLAAPGSADAGALYFVWGGANDLRAAPAAATISPTILNLTNIVAGLYTSGARKFLLPNLPDLGLTPEAIAQDLLTPGYKAGATALSEGFNGALASAYGSLLGFLPGASFTSFSAMVAQRALVAGVGSNGFSNVTDMCFNAAVPSLCATPNTYLYFDNIHPTTAAHMLLGSQMAAAVPEPESMLLMAVGLVALLGLRRRGQAVNAA